MRRLVLLVGVAVGAGLLVLMPPAVIRAEDASGSLGGVPSAGSGYFGFTRITTSAQSQMATGYFFAIGDEVNRLVGASTLIDGPPTNTRAVAAFVQRGVGATYVYGVAGGPGGTHGVLPDPPPGEADAYYPIDPHEMTFSGPVTATHDGTEPRTVDGQFHAKADKDSPTATADAAVTRFEVPNYFSVQHAMAVSHTSPVTSGVDVESVSVLHGLSIGPLHIETMTSRAHGFIPSLDGDVAAAASTVVEGATVNTTPVQVTDHGVIVADKSTPRVQDQVAAALAAAGLSDVRLLSSLSNPGHDRQQVSARAGVLQVLHRDDKFGASNPQGFKGGGFSLGGAEIAITVQRCSPACTASAGGDIPGLTPPPSSSPSSGTPGYGSTASSTSAVAGASVGGAPNTAGTAEDAVGSPPAELGAPTEPGLHPSAPPRHPAARVRSGLSRAMLVANAMEPGDAGRLRDIFVALAGALVVMLLTRGLLLARR